MKYITVRVEIDERYLKKINGKLSNLIMAQPVSFISTYSGLTIDPCGTSFLSQALGNWHAERGFRQLKQ